MMRFPIIFAKLAIAGIFALGIFAPAGGAYAWQEVILYNFRGGSDGAIPSAGLTRDDAGNFYGPTWLGGNANAGTVFRLATDGTESVFYAFHGGHQDGDHPSSRLVKDAAGNFYGTTAQGGYRCYKFKENETCGTVFVLSPTGTEALYKIGQYGRGYIGDGVDPEGRLVLGANGVIYGTTFRGGAIGANCGVVFTIANGGETLLYKFHKRGGDGCKPMAGLLPDNTGSFYGTTTAEGRYGWGTVFKLGSDGSESVIYSFAGQANGDGEYPVANLIMDKAGNLYGTTELGGIATTCTGSGSGTIFRITPDGTETVLYSFKGGSDGCLPEASLTMDGSGNLYGTTAGGGSMNSGTVFKLAPDGTESVIYTFTGSNGDGAYPISALITDSAGNLYGTTENGGGSGLGTVFELLK